MKRKRIEDYRNWLIFPALVTLLIVVTCSASNYGASRPASPTPSASPPTRSPSATPSATPAAKPQPAAKGSGPSPAQVKPQTDTNPCQVNGQTYCRLNPQVTQATIGQTICRRNWTGTVRPDDLSPVKHDQMAHGINLHAGDRNLKHYELDHRMPLELGGDTGANLAVTTNLSLEWADAPMRDRPFHNHKDDDEDAFKYRVCWTGESLRQAQTEFVNRWLAPWPAYK